MPSVGLSFLILGLVVASAIAENSTTAEIDSTNQNSSATNPINIPSTTQNSSTTNHINITSIPSTTSKMAISSTNSTITPSTTMEKDGEKLLTTPKPIIPSRSTSGKSTNNRVNSTPGSQTVSGNNAGIIILVVIIIGVIGFGIVCYFARKRERRYSVDFTSRPDETNIPLSTVEPELTADTVSQNGLQTFESIETTTKEPQESDATPDVEEEQKAEADKSVVDPSAESAAPAPAPVTSVDKPKEVVAEQTPPAPAEPSVEEKTDDEDLVSNKTSVESLKETNENNSNNADLTARDLRSSNIFWDIPLDCPV